MIVYPAIDLRGGRVVRLKEGDPKRQTVFNDDPIAVAQQWIDAGASWLHMVNLDGAFSETNDNEGILQQAAQLDVKVQFGGGLRSMDDIVRAIERGASRVVLGTLALKQPEVVEAAIQRFGADAITVALDARDGKIATQGWQEISEVTPLELGKAMAARGVMHALYTDVSRDGGLGGANVEGTIALGQQTGLQVVASGGVSEIEEIEVLARSGAVAGAVIGMALYEGKLKLSDALQAAKVETNAN